MVTESEFQDPYAEHVGVRLLDVHRDRVAVEQADREALDNHVGIRHASALYTAAWNASRTLVLAALRERGSTARPELIDSEIRYEQVPLGTITTVAEPAGGDWGAPDAEGAELHVTAISTNASDKTVVSLATTWRVAPSPRR